MNNPTALSQDSTALTPGDGSICPHAATLDAADELILPMPKRMVVQYRTTPAGKRELDLFYGDKEISFDEPELFEFGETLAKQSRFAAIEATTWGSGYTWPRVRTLLEELIAGGVLRLASETDDAPALRADGAWPSPLPPAPAKTARTWFESEAITTEIAGRSLETGYLELVVPIFRVAHMSLDADGRHVGEANVFPPALRTEVPTRWRTCIYEGTRHQVDRPMNVTALKSMRAHWGAMMAAVLAIREAYLHRFPAARNGWTVGHLERLSVCVLALPAYLMMRTRQRVANGELHPALSSLFRVTDGVRMTMHQMLFVPLAEPALSPDTPMTSAEIYAYAERNYSFHSSHGVCAGPRSMIEEFFAVIVDGIPPKGGLPEKLAPQVEQALADLDPALDYGLLGLQAYASIFSLWPVMTRTYEKLESIAAKHASQMPAMAKLRDYLADRMSHIVKTGFLATEDRRAHRESVYADMYAQCSRGLGDEAPTPALAAQTAPRPTMKDETAGLLLRAALVRYLGISPSTHVAGLGDLHACLMEFLQRTQAILRVACNTQRRINVLLERAAPQRPFSAADIDIHLRLRDDHDDHSPTLLHDLETLLRIRIDVQEHGFYVSDGDRVERA